MPYIQKPDERKNDNTKIVNARVSEDVLKGLSMADDDSNSISLRVSKAIPSDVGHGRARISGESGLELKPGDIIEIKGENRTTAAIYWRSRPIDG